jgi:WD40 repeat protein
MIPTTLLAIAVLLHAPERAAVARYGTPKMVLSGSLIHVSPDGRRITDGMNWIDLTTETRMPAPTSGVLQWLTNGNYVCETKTGYALRDGTDGRDLSSFTSKQGIAFSPTVEEMARKEVTNDSAFVQVARWPKTGEEPLWVTVTKTSPDIYALRYNQDGSHLFWTVSEQWQGFDNSIYVHNLKAGKTTRLLPRKPNKYVSNVALSPDGKRAVTLEDGLHLHDTETGQILETYANTEKKYYRQLDFTPDGKWAIGSDHTSSVFDLFPVNDPKAEPRTVAAPEGNGIKCFAISADSKRLLVVDEGRVLRVYDLATGKRVDRSVQDSWIGIGWVSESQTICWSRRGQVKIWDVATQKTVRELSLETLAKDSMGVHLAQISPNGKYLAVWEKVRGKNQTEFRIIDLTSGKTIINQGEPLHIYSVAFHPNGERVRLSTKDTRRESDGGQGECSHEYKLATGKRLSANRLSVGETIFSHDGRSIYCSSRTHRALNFECYELATNNRRFFEIYMSDSPNTVSDTSSCIGVDSKTGIVWVAAKQTAYGLSPFDGHTKWVLRHLPASNFGHPLSASNNGHFLLASSYDFNQFGWMVDAHFTVYDVRTEEGRRHPLVSPMIPEVIFQSAFSPDDKQVAILTIDGEQTVWNLERLRNLTPKPDLLATAWENLTGDAELAAKAMSALVAKADHAVEYLSGKLPPVANLDAAQVKKWLGELGSTEYKTRTEAENKLMVVLDTARRMILAAAENPSNAEAGERLGRLVERIEMLNTKPDYLRVLRTVEIVEQIGTPAARKLLERWATGAPDAILTKQAQESIRRLSKK